ncbi:MAG TPA: carbon-nitrogen hydrolase family protein [Nitrososphaeraceae archaeon]
MTNNCRIAVIQMKSTTKKSENLEASIDYIKEAAGKKAQLVCFPEFQMAYSPTEQSAKELLSIAENVQGQFISTLRTEAKRSRINVIATIFESRQTEQSNNKSRSKHHNDRVSDTAVIISNQGQIKSIYRKLHLYDALGFKESDKLASGNKIIQPLRTNSGKIGLMICYDVRFPEMSRILALAGAEILAIPSAWVQGVMKEEHWQIMLKARAIENGCYVIAPDQVGNIYSGRSMVIDPFGITLLDMGAEEGLEIIEIARNRLKSVRNSLPLLDNRRIDAYRNFDNLLA